MTSYNDSDLLSLISDHGCKHRLWCDTWPVLSWCIFREFCWTSCVILCVLGGSWCCDVDDVCQHSRCCYTSGWRIDSAEPRYVVNPWTQTFAKV